MNNAIAVLGAGLIGSVLAVALKKNGFSVSLFDKKPLILSDCPQGDPRALFLSLKSVQLLKNWGIWQQLPETAYTACQRMCIWDQDFEVIQFDAQDINALQLGWIVSHDALVQAAQTQAGQDFYPQTLIEFQEANTEDVSIDVKGVLKKFSALIACDGSGSNLLKKLGITHQLKDYQQLAWVGQVKSSQVHQNTAYQRFVDDQIIGLLPRHESHTFNLIWSVSHLWSEQHRTDSLEKLSSLLTQAFDNRLGRLEILTPPQSFPLRATHAHAYGRGRVLCIGDSIHTVHPLAGQGANLGLADIDALINCLKAYPESRWGEEKLVTKLERMRRSENAAILHGMTFLKTIYAAQEQPWAWLRRAGLRALNKSAWLKGWGIRLMSK